MKVTRNALTDVLLAASGVTALVGTYRSYPAIFARDTVPPQVSGRYVVVDDAYADAPGVFDTKTTRGRAIFHDIGVYEDETGDSSELEQLADTIRDLFDRNPVAVSGYGQAVITRALGPLLARNEDEQVYGRIVTVALELAKEGVG